MCHSLFSLTTCISFQKNYTCTNVASKLSNNIPQLLSKECSFHVCADNDLSSLSCFVVVGGVSSRTGNIDRVQSSAVPQEARPHVC